MRIDTVWDDATHYANQFPDSKRETANTAFMAGVLYNANEIAKLEKELNTALQALRAVKLVHKPTKIATSEAVFLCEGCGGLDTWVDYDTCPTRTAIEREYALSATEPSDGS